MRNIKLAALFVSLLILLTGCKADDTSSTSSTSSEQTSSEIVGTLYPSDQKYNGSAEKIYTNNALIENRSFTTSKKNTSALRLQSGKFTLAGVSVSKKGGSSESVNLSRLFGLNAALIVRSGARATFKDGEVLSKAAYSASVFAYSDKTSLIFDNGLISSSGKNGYGIIAAGGAEIKSNNTTVNASGEKATTVFAGAGGKINIENCVLSSQGLDSPVLSSSGEIYIKNSSLTAGRSQVVEVLSGGNAVLENCEISGTRKNFQDVTDTDLYTVALRGGEKPASLTLKGSVLKNAKNHLFRISGKAELTLEDIRVEAIRGEIFNLKKGADAVIYLNNINLSGDLSTKNDATVKLVFGGNSTFYGNLSGKDSKTKYSVVLEKGTKAVFNADTYLEAFDGNLDDIEINGSLYVAGEKVK